MKHIVLAKWGVS